MNSSRSAEACLHLKLYPPLPHRIHPVLSVLIRSYSYLVARYDIDGYRIDTVKYVEPHAVETFGNAMRSFHSRKS